MAGTPRIPVLIIDGHEAVARSLRRALAPEKDIRVVATVGTAAEAQQAAVAHHPDVVVLGYLLADGDGAGVANAIRKLLPQVRILLLTGGDSDEVLRTAAEDGRRDAWGTGGTVRLPGPLHRAFDSSRFPPGGSAVGGDQLVGVDRRPMAGVEFEVGVVGAGVT